MENHLDFTIDFETCSLSANAAVMQVAVVPWLRGNEENPFCNDDELQPYVGHVDLRTCVVEGFDFDQSTVKWWSERSTAAKDAVTSGLPEPVSDVLVSILDYIRGIVKKYSLQSICLWCQGPDVDIAILRNMCRKFDIILEDCIPHTSFRDCRTLILEAALILAERGMSGKGTLADGIALPHQIQADPSLAYKLFTPPSIECAEGMEAHNAIFDAMRSSWNTWQALKLLRQQ